MEQTLQIEQLERDSATGGVKVAHWRINAVDGDYTATVYGSVGFDPDPTSPDFKPFEALTKTDVEGWVLETLDLDSLTDSLQSQIDNQKNPPVLIGLPW